MAGWGEEQEWTARPLFSTFIKKVFIDVIWRGRKYYKDWIFDVNLFMIKNQAEKKRNEYITVHIKWQVFIKTIDERCLQALTSRVQARTTDESWT